MYSLNLRASYDGAFMVFWVVFSASSSQDLYAMILVHDGTTLRGGFSYATKSVMYSAFPNKRTFRHSVLERI